jgi:ABC-type transport system involved in multi-copper enzyme maturation permease subunit
MVSLLSTTWLMFRTHLARILFTRRIGLCVLGALVPAAIAWLAIHTARRHVPDPVEVVLFPGWHLGLQVLVPLVALIAGSAVVSEEIDDRTITYLITRPIPRAAILLGRWLATAVIQSAILAGGIWLLAWSATRGAEGGMDVLGEGVVGPLLAMAVLGGLTYSALFAAAGTFLKHPMIVGLGYTFAIEGFLANLPGRSQGLTIQYYLRSYVVGAGSELWSKVTEELPSAVFDPAGESLVTLLVITVLSLAVGSWVLSRRQYLLTS